MQTVQRPLRCSPAAGGYRAPAAACAALAGLVRLRRTHPRNVCYCALALGRPPVAGGRFDAHPVTIPLDPCSYCGDGSGATADLAILAPHATG
jgi:hypothetical protein